MIKPVCLGLSIFDIRKMVMYKYWSEFLKLKYDNIVKLCYMDTDSFIVHVKTKYVYPDPAEDVEKDWTLQFLKLIDRHQYEKTENSSD